MRGTTTRFTYLRCNILYGVQSTYRILLSSSGFALHKQDVPSSISGARSPSWPQQPTQNADRNSHAAHGRDAFEPFPLTLTSAGRRPARCSRR